MASRSIDYKFVILRKMLANKPYGYIQHIRKKIGCSTTALYQWANATPDNPRQIHYKYQLKICEVLGITLEELNTPGYIEFDD